MDPLIGLNLRNDILDEERISAEPTFFQGLKQKLRKFTPQSVTEPGFKEGISAPVGSEIDYSNLASTVGGRIREMVVDPIKNYAHAIDKGMTDVNKLTIKDLLDITSANLDLVAGGGFTRALGKKGVDPNMLQSFPGWHGSGASFKKFSDEFIGSGEGAQMYSVGHYIGGSHGIGNNYARQAARKVQSQKSGKLLYKGKELVENFDAETPEVFVTTHFVQELASEPVTQKRLDETFASLKDYVNSEKEAALTGDDFNNYPEAYFSTKELVDYVDTMDLNDFTLPKPPITYKGAALVSTDSPATPEEWAMSYLKSAGVGGKKDLKEGLLRLKKDMSDEVADIADGIEGQWGFDKQKLFYKGKQLVFDQDYDGPEDWLMGAILEEFAPAKDNKQRLEAVISSYKARLYEDHLRMSSGKKDSNFGFEFDDFDAKDVYDVIDNIDINDFDIKSTKDWPEQISKFLDTLDTNDFEFNTPKEHLYKTTVMKGKEPEEYDFMDWHKDINEQPGVKKKLEKTKLFKEFAKYSKFDNDMVYLDHDLGFHRAFYYAPNLNKQEKKIIAEVLHVQMDNSLSAEHAIKKMISSTNKKSKIDFLKQLDPEDFKSRAISTLGEGKGQGFYEYLKEHFSKKLNTKNDFEQGKAASKFLFDAGIAGTKFKAGTFSGGARPGLYNHVVFDPDEIFIDKHYINGVLQKPKPKKLYFGD